MPTRVVTVQMTIPARTITTASVPLYSSPALPAAASDVTSRQLTKVTWPETVCNIYSNNAQLMRYIQSTVLWTEPLWAGRVVAAAQTANVAQNLSLNAVSNVCRIDCSPVTNFNMPAATTVTLEITETYGGRSLFLGGKKITAIYRGGKKVTAIYRNGTRLFRQKLADTIRRLAHPTPTPAT